jgi:hypothetical protein
LLSVQSKCLDRVSTQLNQHALNNNGGNEDDEEPLVGDDRLSCLLIFDEEVFEHIDLTFTDLP